MKNGWYLLQDRVEDCLKSLKEYRDQLYPPLPRGWKENPEDPAPTERIKHAVEPEPTSEAARKKGRLADYFDLHHSTKQWSILQSSQTIMQVD